MLLGYFVMGLMFLALRFFYHILPKKGVHDHLIKAVEKDFINLFIYIKEIVLSHAKIFKAILVIIVVLLALTQKKYTDGIVYVIEDILAMIMYLLLVIVFMPKENDVLRQGSHSPRRNQQRFQRGHAERRGKGAVESPLYRQRCFRCPRGCHRRRRSGQVPGDGRRSEPQDA
ncbi:MAG: hypothetical protein IJT01_07610 [Selenomonadaceae bacterium]|nr:hypothetical protein [Selenomonadaceae bacterium]